jgi:dTMP kinase
MGLAKGIFITLEGIEGSGKTTQAELLRDLLLANGHKVVITREPGGSPIGEKIRDILLDVSHIEMAALTELLLYEASRCQHVYQTIKPALDEGKVVICDRFYDASTAYQGYGRGLDIEMVKNLNLVATEGQKADLTIVLDLPVAEGLRRLGQNLDRIEAETVGFHEKVRQGYLDLARSEPDRVKVIDASGSVEETFEKVRAIIESIIPLKKGR